MPTLELKLAGRIQAFWPVVQKRLPEIIFPPCTDDLLDPVGKVDPISNNADKITDIHDEYFQKPERDVDGESAPTFLESSCLPKPTKVDLIGIRRTFSIPVEPNESPLSPVKLSRLFIADLAWLFYMERMGVFQLLGAILDDYATKGRFTIPNQGQTLKQLEVMVRQVKSGLSSTVRDRDSAYRRCLGWTSEPGRKLALDTMVNSAFNTAFHALVQTALVYYKERRTISALQVSTTTPSQATLTDVKDAVRNLRDSFDQFNKFGRNYTIALSGIVWAIAGLGLVRDVRNSIGVSEQFEEPRQYVTAAYNLLIVGKDATSSQGPNRYTTHLDCARHARDILLDVEALGVEQTPEWDFRTWLDMMEGTFEAYRVAYRALTGTDLGVLGTPAVEQQV